MNLVKYDSYISKAKEIILFVVPGEITKQKIKYIKEIIRISKVNLKGWIYINSN